MFFAYAKCRFSHDMAHFQRKYEGPSRSNRTFAIIIVHVYISKNNVHEMKDGSFIDKSVEFQINRSMDIKSAQHLVRLVQGGRGTL